MLTMPDVPAILEVRLIKANDLVAVNLDGSKSRSDDVLKRTRIK